MLKVFCERLRAERMAAHKTLAAAANDLGIPKRTYESYESAALSGREPDLAMLVRLADYYDVSLDYLCGRDEYR